MEYQGEYFADYDEPSGMWCVFHTDKRPGHAYSTHADEAQAVRRAAERNEDDRLRRLTQQ